MLKAVFELKPFLQFGYSDGRDGNIVFIQMIFFFRLL